MQNLSEILVRTNREAARAIQQTLNTKANDHLTFGYFEKAIINFHSNLSSLLDAKNRKLMKNFFLFRWIENPIHADF